MIIATCEKKSQASSSLWTNRWGSKTAYSQIRLDALAAESVQQLLAGLLGPGPALAPLMLQLARQGNPFFLEETVRTLVETGALAGERGSFRLTRPVETLQVPGTVQTVLAARIDRLPPEEKQLLQAASAIGKDVPYALLAAIAELADDVARRSLAHLQEAEFVYETQLFPDLEYTFKHALTHEVTYGSMLGERRRQLHAQIVSVIERVYAERLSEHVERLAHHALRGQLWDKAVRYSRQSGNRALDRSALLEALSQFENARAALKELPDSKARAEQLIDLCFEQRSALIALGDFSQQSQIVSEALVLARGLGDQRRLGWVLGFQSVVQNFLGQHSGAIEAGKRACAIAKAVDDLGLRAGASFYVGQALWFSGDARRAAAALKTAIDVVKDAPLNERLGLAALPPVLARLFLAAVLAELGDFPQALVVGEEGLQIAQKANHPYSEIYARYGLGWAHLRQGNFAMAVRVLEPGLAVCRAMEIRFMLPLLAAGLGAAYLRSDRSEEAVALLEEAVQASTSMRMLGLRAWIITLLAECYFVHGRIAQAREHAEKALAVTRAQGERGWELWALKLLAEIQAYELAKGDDIEIDQACVEKLEAMYGQVLTAAGELGMRPLIAHCHLGLAKLHIGSNQRDKMRDHLERAVAMYREMDMKFWFDQASALHKKAG